MHPFCSSFSLSADSVDFLAEMARQGLAYALRFDPWGDAEFGFALYLPRTQVPWLSTRASDPNQAILRVAKEYHSHSAGYERR